MNRFALLAVACLSLALAGCGKVDKGAQNGGTKRANVFRYPINRDPTTLDPGEVQDGDTIDLLQNVYEGLVGWGTDNQVVPLVAEKWDVSSDGKTYTFHIRHGVKFHNGREVTADDFKWTFERNCSKDFASPVASGYLDDIAGAMDKINGKATEVKGVQVADPYTLKITLLAPRAYFLGKLTYLTGAVVCKEAIKEKPSAAGIPLKQIRSGAEMVGTGPYKVVSYVPNQVTVLEPFADYRGGKPKVDRMERPVMGDASTRLNKFKSGEIDLVQLERQDVAALQKDSTYSGQLHFYPRPSIFYIGMNSEAQPAFKNRNLRRAIGMAIDRKYIVEQVLGGLVDPANSIIPPGVFGHRDNAAVLPFDVNAAKKALADAGLGDPSSVQLEITYRADRPDIRIVAESVAAQLKQNLGLNVKQRQLDWKQYLETWNRGQIGFFHMRWAADYLDPENFVSHMLASYGAENRGILYHNPDFDNICRQADAELDPNKRTALYAKAEDIALQDAPWVPIYFQKDTELISPHVKGLRDSLFGHLPHTTVSIE